jgi:TatD DNase family protein
MWTDSHCHVQSLSDDDLRSALDRARTAGVRRVVMVGTDEASSRRASAVAMEHGGHGAPAMELWATVGLHPHDASVGTEEISRYLGELSASGLSASRVVAVGECGLDYHYDYSPRDDQRKAFADQVALAHKHGLALVIHTREAWDDTFAVLDSEASPSRVVFHCFTGGPEEAQGCLDRGAYLSFSGIVTFTSAGDIQAAATLCPLDRLMVETDSPFLTPVPHRGRPNEPSYVPLVGSRIAELKGLDVAEVAQATTTNAAVVFNIHS